MADAKPAWADEEPPGSGFGEAGGAAGPAWMDEEPFGDAPQPSTASVAGGPNAGYHNPMVDPGSWNAATSLAHGASLGADIPAAVEILARREADTFRKAGADEAFIAKEMPNWRAQAQEGILRSKAQYHQLAPGMDLGAEVAGSIPTTMAGVGLAGRAGTALAETLGVPGVARFLGGTAGRAMAPGAARDVVQSASRISRGLTQGAETGAIQSPLNRDEPALEQIRKGALLGVGTEAVMPWVRDVARAGVGSFDPATARAGLAAEAQGVPVTTRAIGPTAIQPTALAAARAKIAGEYNDIASKGKVVPDPQLYADLRSVQDNLKHKTTLTPHEVTAVNQAYDLMNTHLNGGGIDGPAYRQLTGKGGTIDGLIRDPNLSDLGQQLRGALDSARDRSLAANQPDLYARLHANIGREHALNTVEQYQAQPGGAHPLLHRLLRGGTHAGIGAGVGIGAGIGAGAVDLGMELLSNPRTAYLALGGAGASFLARRGINALMSNAPLGLRRVLLRANAQGLNPFELGRVPNPAIAGANRLMEYNPNGQ